MFRGRRLAAVLVFLGVALLVAGWRASGYFADLLLNVGTALLLFAPLLSLQRLVEARVTRVQEETTASVAALSSQVADVQQQVTETGARLDQLSESTMDRLQQAQDRDSHTFAAFEEAPSKNALTTLLDRAQDLRGIEPSGVRVRVPGTWARLRFAVSRHQEEGGEFQNVTQLLATVESFGGAEQGRVEWLPDQPADAFMAEVAKELQKCGEFRPEAFNATRILEQLMEALRIAIGGRTGVARYRSLEPIVEIPNDQWVVMTSGIIAPEAGYFIQNNRLLEDDDYKFRNHISQKKWVDADKFQEAWDVAAALQKERSLEPPF
jgi:hypothetical protein